eukprot:5680978-Amphidinium_carterae.1
MFVFGMATHSASSCDTSCITCRFPNRAVLFQVYVYNLSSHLEKNMHSCMEHSVARWRSGNAMLLVVNA